MKITKVSCRENKICEIRFPDKIERSNTARLSGFSHPHGQRVWQTETVYFPHSALHSSAGRFSHFGRKGREIEQTNRSSRERDEFHQAVPSATVSNVCHLLFADLPLVSNCC